MGVIRAILMVLFVLVCIALTVVVLMQEGKSNGLGAIAGGNSFWEQNKSRSAEGKIVLATKILAIAFIVLALAVFGGIFISATSPMGFTDAVSEAVSALATVGLSAGGTASLSIPAQILIIIYMYFGRVGVLTISLGFLAGNRAEERFRYAETNLLIG